MNKHQLSLLIKKYQRLIELEKNSLKKALYQTFIEDLQTLA
ncbi:hypothetical protein [Olivibacter jilunii]